MKYLLLVLLALSLGCQQKLVKLTLENASQDEALVEMTLNDEITLSATQLKHDVELLEPGEYVADIYLHKSGWVLTLNVVDTITIEQTTRCIAFDGDELITWE